MVYCFQGVYVKDVKGYNLVVIFDLFHLVAGFSGNNRSQ